jgi:GT2 family glycosyltransferase
MSSADLSSIERSQQLMLETVDAGADVALVVCGRRVSDELAAAGARKLLRGMPFRELWLDQLPSARGETALLLGGGFLRADHDVMPRALAVAELCFARVVVLPASFDPSDEAVQDALIKTRATVFAREPESYGRIAELCDARLAHDCSFFVDFTPYLRAGEGVLDAFGNNRVPDLERWLEGIAAHRMVRTDQAHVMIAAALMDKHVEYAMDSEPGVEPIAKHALADRDVAAMAPPTTKKPLVPATLDAQAEATIGRLSSAALTTPPPTPTTSTAPVTAVVLTRDRPALLLRTLASIERSQVPMRTLVIDNNSGPAAARALAGACGRSMGTELKRSERNLGCAGGRRLGAELADTEFVLFLDDDAELMPGALQHLLSELEWHPDAGAATATVVRPDGTVFHSGGSMKVTQELVTFELLGDGIQFTDAALPPSGSSGWAPGTAMLVRAALLAEFPFDETMGAYFEDNEWCYRISRRRGDSFRRSCEALVVHHMQPKHAPLSDFVSRSRMVELLASYARFYQLHDRLLGPWLFEHVPGMRAADGSCDLAAARLLMELVIAKGTDWIFMEWMRGDLDGLLSNRRRHAAEAAVARLRGRAAYDASTIAALDTRLNDATLRLNDATLRLNDATLHLQRIGESVTWKAFLRARTWAFKLLGGEQSRGVRMLQGTLRPLGRRLLRGSSESSGERASLGLTPSRRSASPIQFAEVTEPHVSIVIHLCGQAERTEATLRSILGNAHEPSYEVVLVHGYDDGPTRALLGRVQGARVTTNETNLGYLQSVKRGADAARGRWLVLCKNDIEVQPGWLAALVDCGESRPDVAVVAPKFVCPDGSLAEAGGIIWRDGAGANYGRGHDPADCHYEYRREIDYGSAAALMVRKDFWREVGGFDQRFDPGCYEDVDLCFEARRRGLRAMYAPRAGVVHVGCAIAGVNESGGYERHQEQNRAKFVKKWHELLEREHLENERGNLWLAANLRRRRRVLVVDNHVPIWNRDMDGLRMREMLEALIDLGCHVSLLPDDGVATEPYTPELQRLGIEVLYGSDQRVELDRIGLGLSLVILSGTKVAERWLEPVREVAPSAPIVFDAVDLQWLRHTGQPALTGNGNRPSPAVSMTTMRELEVQLIRGADATLVLSEGAEAQMFADLPEAAVYVVPNVQRLREPVAPLAGRSGVLFVGEFEQPESVEAALLLVREVMPLVWRELPDVPVEIVGADAPQEVQALAAELVDVRDSVPELDPLLESARVMVMPSTYGVAPIGRMTEALAYGLPMVTTPVDAAGLNAIDGEEILIGQQPDELAACVVRVMRDDKLWQYLSSAGRRLIDQRCSREVVHERVRQLLDELPGAVEPVKP